MAIKEWVLTDHSCGLWVENLNLDENDMHDTIKAIKEVVNELQIKIN